MLATGKAHSVREFVEKAFATVGTRIEWRGAGVDEKGFDAASGRVLVEVDRRYFRPAEVDVLVGDATKARTKLGWRHTISFDELVTEMVETDLELMKREHGRDVAVTELATPLVGARKPRRTRAAR